MKEQINKMSDLIEKWLKPLPHLPNVFVKTLAENLWWIIIVGIVFTAMAVFSSIGAIAIALGAANRINSVLGVYATPVNLAPTVIMSIVSAVFMVASVAILGIAVAPIKSLSRKGWNLLFIGMLLNAVYIVILAVMAGWLGFLPTLIGGALGIAITAYLLNEIKDQFKKTAKVKPLDSEK